MLPALINSKEGPCRLWRFSVFFPCINRDQSTQVWSESLDLKHQNVWTQTRAKLKEPLFRQPQTMAASLATGHPYPERFFFPLFVTWIQSKWLSPKCQCFTELTSLVFVLVQPFFKHHLVPIWFFQSPWKYPCPPVKQVFSPIMFPLLFPYFKSPFLGKEYYASVGLKWDGTRLKTLLFLPCINLNFTRPPVLSLTLPCCSSLYFCPDCFPTTSPEPFLP